MKKPMCWALWERVDPRRATVALFVDGEWSGASRYDLPIAAHAKRLEEYVYRYAEQMAAVKGHQLDRCYEGKLSE